MHVVTIEPQQLFQALSDFTRIRILRVLVSSGKESCLCELSQCLQEPEYKLSRHVKTLRQSGLLSAEKEGRWIYHRIPNEKKLKSLLMFISEIADSNKIFSEDLRAFRKIIAARAGGRCLIQNQETPMKKATKAKVSRL